MPAARRALCVLAAAVLGLAACSNTESPVNRVPNSGSATASTVAGVQRITIKAGVNDRFYPSTITVHRGKVQVVLEHTGTIGGPHNWTLLDFPGDFVPYVEAGQTKSSDVFMAPAPGRYEFVCTFHERQGQTGTLIVTAS